jgi:plasmid maintenance system antidote protein VapI
MRRSASKEVGSYLAWRIREWIKSGKTSAELAKVAGISGAQVSDVLHGNTGAGWKTAEGLGRAFGMSMAEVLSAAEEWAKTHAPPAKEPPRQPAPARDRRAHAAELAEEHEVSAEAIASVLSEPEDVKRSTVWWILRMLRRDLELAETNVEPAVRTSRTITRSRG